MPTQRVLALVDRQAATRERLSGNLLALLARLWAALTTGQRYDDAQVAAFAAQAAALSKGARTAASGAQEAYLRQILALLDTQPGRGLHVSIPDAPRGVDPVMQYTRPVEEFRRLRVSGLDEFDANERALNRLRVIADYDMQIAERDTTHQVLASTEKITGYRRILHPELPTPASLREGRPVPDVCGACVVAADRVYYVGDLKALHSACRCTVLPIVKGKADPGAQIHADDLKRIYEIAGSTKADDLRKTRIAIHRHGEIGDILAFEGQHFRGPAEVKRDTSAA
jgi:hypothetical protein